MDLLTVIFVGITVIVGSATVAPAKILVIYPLYLSSHYQAYRPLIEELVRRGHEITAYTTAPSLKSLPNFKHTRINVQTNLTGFDPMSIRSMSATACLQLRCDVFTPTTEAALQSEELQALMQSEEHFDLMIAEALFVQESVLAFAHKFNVPVVSLVSHYMEPWVAQSAGVPHSFSYIPNVLLDHSDHMSFWQRTKNALIGTYMMLHNYFYYLPTQERIMRKHVNYRGSENLPPLQDLISDISLHLVHSHYLLTSVRPYPPNVIEIAGISIKPAEELPEDLKKFLDEAAHGFIYVSFGTIVDAKTFPKRFRTIFMKTLKGVKQKVIMKWSEKVEGVPNILARPWLPQKDILAHPNCKLFITHGGFSSLLEAMTAGIPTIGLPFFADQWHNVAYYVHRGVGLEISIETETETGLTEKINRIIHTPSFMENAKRIAALNRDEPQSRLDKVVFWVEYVIRHKGAHHLKPASIKMPYYKYLLLDVLVFLSGAFFLAVYVLYFIVRKISAYLCSSKHVSEGKKYK